MRRGSLISQSDARFALPDTRERGLWCRAESPALNAGLRPPSRSSRTKTVPYSVEHVSTIERRFQPKRLCRFAASHPEVTETLKLRNAEEGQSMRVELILLNDTVDAAQKNSELVRCSQ
jgi:hypothetical protein